MRKGCDGPCTGKNDKEKHWMKVKDSAKTHRQKGTGNLLQTKRKTRLCLWDVILNIPKEEKVVITKYMHTYANIFMYLSTYFIQPSMIYKILIGESDAMSKSLVQSLWK